MFFDEMQQGGTTPDVLKYVLGGIGLLLSNALTYWLSRPKSKSELAKNLADTQKSEADTAKIRVETIALLLKEVDEMIATTLALRSEIDIRSGERAAALNLIRKMSAEAGELIDLTLTTGSVQVVRMKMVGISERLHNLREILELKKA